MIVVLGSPSARTRDGAVVPAGIAGTIAVAAAETGAPVQVVGRIGDDDRGDQLVLALARAGIGHAAILRDASPTPAVSDADALDDGPMEEADAGPETGPALDAADVALGLRYITDFSVLVVADPLSDAARRAAIDAGRFAGARIVALVPPGAPWTDGADDVFEAPPGGGEAVGSMIGRYAAALDAGVPPADAFGYATGPTGWSRVAAD